MGGANRRVRNCGRERACGGHAGSGRAWSMPQAQGCGDCRIRFHNGGNEDLLKGNMKIFLFSSFREPRAGFRSLDEDDMENCDPRVCEDPFS